MPGRISRAFMNSFIGLVCGGAPLFAIGWIWEKLRHVEAMGGGDVKLMGMVGSFLGWKSALLTIMLGAVAGSVVGVMLDPAETAQNGERHSLRAVPGRWCAGDACFTAPISFRGTWA